MRPKHYRVVDVQLSPSPFVCQVDRFFRFSVLGLVIFFLTGVSWAGDLPVKAAHGLVWEVNLAPNKDYFKEVEALLAAYEAETGSRLAPGKRGKVGLKVNTRGGAGLSTPSALIRALIAALGVRGYKEEAIFILDYSAHDLRGAGIMPSRSRSGDRFEGVRILPLDSGAFYEPDWYYDSPLPPAFQQEPQLLLGGRQGDSLIQGTEERKSFLPAPLLFEVDFWMNLAVGVDDPALGVDGALANLTLWNVSNSRRFLVNQATASAAVAEIAAIPELAERLVLNFVSLDTYQFIGGPFFNSIYTRSEPRLWMSSDPVALDRLLFERINSRRRYEGFPEIDPLPKQLPFAASLGLGVHERGQIRIESIQIKHAEVQRPQMPREVPKFEQAPNWLRKLTPW